MPLDAKPAGNTCAPGVCASFGSCWEHFCWLARFHWSIPPPGFAASQESWWIPSVQQTDLTRSLAQEIQLFEANLTQQLLSERQILALTGLIDNVEDPSAEPKVTACWRNCLQQSQYVSLPDGGGKSGKRHKRLAGKFPR